ncbi:hypothetical protein PG993_007924 [Apiospora rasikravindrae]|uniref:Uncharacterized protein n=1 Tax=Apiospora rasikravindrae TaxID=990691 RepID=A0ABR1T163_9PEZI
MDGGASETGAQQDPGSALQGLLAFPLFDTVVFTPVGVRKCHQKSKKSLVERYPGFLQPRQLPTARLALFPPLGIPALRELWGWLCRMTHYHIAQKASTAWEKQSDAPHDFLPPFEPPVPIQADVDAWPLSYAESSGFTNHTMARNNLHQKKPPLR